jgi:predicted outer membrane lipoprotein
MTYLLGMDLFVFIAWIGTILAAIFCVIYGIYHELIKKSNDTNLKHKKNNKKSKKEA